MSDDATRQSLAFLKSLVGNLDVAKWPTQDDGTVTYVESFRSVTVWKVGDEVFASVATKTGTEVTLAGSDYELVRTLASAVGVTGVDGDE